MGNRSKEFGVAGWAANSDWAVKVVGNAGASKTLDNSDVNDLTLSAASCALTLPTPVVGQKLRLIVRQDATGSRVIAWTGAHWAGGTAPTLSTPASAVDYLVFECWDAAFGWVGSMLTKAVA